MNNQINSLEVTILNAKMTYLRVGNITGLPVILLHGASFNSQIWSEIGTLNVLAEAGYLAIALDLPGYGASQSLSGFRDTFLVEFINKLNLNLPVIVSPSMSGSYSLPTVANHSNKLKGFVAVAPVGISQWANQLRGIELPTLAIWGSNDRLVPVSQADLLVQIMPNAQKAILVNAGHACYLRATTQFHHHLTNFLAQINLKSI